MFYNTPARLKFLRKPRTDEADITDFVERLMMAYSNISFKYYVDGKLKFQTMGSGLKDNIYTIYGKEVFDNLEHMFLSGQSIPSSQITVETYSYIHTLDDESQHNMVIYDIPDEVLLSENYERNPLNFAYADGFLLMFDPLSEARAREMSEKLGETVKDGQYSNDSVEDIMIAFIQQFSRLASRSSSKMVDTPVAVVITKADTKAVKFSLRDSVVRKAFDTDPEKYDNDLEKAKSEVYRNYLIQLGLSNAINNLESVIICI